MGKSYFLNPVGNNFEWQYAQHASMVTPEGHIFIFDNGLFRAKKTNEEDKLSGDEAYSRGVAYKIDEDNMTIEQIWQYGKENGSDWYSFYLGDVDYLSKNHYLINSGGQLYPDRENRVILEQIENGQVIEVKELKITTEPLLKEYQNMVEVTNSQGEAVEGITVISGGPIKSPYAFDSSGKVRWYLKVQTKGHGYFPMSDGRFMIMTTDSMLATDKRQYSTKLYNMDFLGRIHKIYSIPKGAHHEIIEKTPGGNFLVLSNTLESHVEDLVVEVDRTTGGIVKELKLGDVIKDTYNEALDWAHINSISYNAKDDSVILSARNLSAAVKINWSTHELNWILSDSRIWEGTEYEEYVLKATGPQYGIMSSIRFMR